MEPGSEDQILPRNVHEITEQPTATEIRRNDEVTRIISEIYEAIPPGVGVHFVEPNVILTVAGLKGTCDIHFALKHDKKNAFDQIDKLNEHLAQYGLSIIYGNDTDSNNAYVGLSLVSLKGFEYTSSQMHTLRSRFGITQYNSSTGFEGLTIWLEHVRFTLERAVMQNELTDTGMKIYMQGIQLGYPEKSIEDFELCYRTGDVQRDLVEAHIISAHPLANTFHGAVPEFDYLPTSSEDRGIKTYIKKARATLRAFYNSTWMKQTINDPTFINTVREQNADWTDYLNQIRKK